MASSAAPSGSTVLDSTPSQLGSRCLSAFDEDIDNLEEDGTDAELHSVQTEQQRSSPESDDSFVMEGSPVGDLGGPIQSLMTHNQQRRSSSTGTGVSTGGPLTGTSLGTA